MGIYTTDKEQIVFIDTPGFTNPRQLWRLHGGSAYSTLREVDTVLFMVPADEARGKGDDMIIERLRPLRCRLFWWSIRSTRCTQTNSWRKSMTSVVDGFQGNRADFSPPRKQCLRLIDILSENLEEGFQYFYRSNH